MKKMKVLITLAGALCVLAFAAFAWAQDDDVLDENHIDDPENGKYVFWDEDEMNEFLLEVAASVDSAYDDEGGGMLDFCILCTPIAYAVSTLHYEGSPSQHWHVSTDIQWMGYDSTFHDCGGSTHMYSDVDGLKTYWKTTSASCCDYCNLENWVPQHKYPAWQDDTGDWDCLHDIYSDDIVYWGYELADFNNYDFTSGDYLSRFKRSSTYLSYVKWAICPE